MAAMIPGVEQETAEMRRARATANKRLAELRRAINRFHTVRALTKQAQLGMVRSKYPADQLAAGVRQMRDTAAEEKAVNDLRDLLAVIHGRSPTVDEMEIGPPEALGAIWVAPAVVLGIAGGAWTLSSLFNYLAAHEERIQQSYGISRPTLWRSVAPVGVPLAIAAALAGGIYWFLQRRKAATASADAEDVEDVEDVEAEFVSNPEPAEAEAEPEAEEAEETDEDGSDEQGEVEGDE